MLLVEVKCKELQGTVDFPQEQVVSHRGNRLQFHYKRNNKDGHYVMLFWTYYSM